MTKRITMVARVSIEFGGKIVQNLQVATYATQADLELIAGPLIAEAGRLVVDGVTVHPRRPTAEEVRAIRAQEFMHRVQLGQYSNLSVTAGDERFGEHADPLRTCPACRAFWTWMGS